MKIIPPLPEDTTRALLNAAEDDDFFVFLESTRITAEERYSYLFRAPVEKIIFRHNDDPAVFWAQAERHLARGYYLAGWFAYEFGYLLEPVLGPGRCDADPDRPLAELGVFKQPHVFDHLTGNFLGDYPWPLAENDADNAGTFSIDSLRFSQAKEKYLENIAAIKKYIEAGDTYQVNYTLKMLFEYGGDTVDFYNRLRRNQRVAYSAMIKSGKRKILSFSPELFFKKDGSRCWVKPMKGTVGRGRNPQEDQDLAGFLQNDIKNRSENVMIVDLLRNDIGKLCNSGTVEVTSLFDVEAFETLQQMTSSIQGQLRDGVGLYEIFKAIYPCGSVTGAPKIRTMEIIRELEAAERGVYTGGIGFFGPDGKSCFNVPIRTVVLEDGKGEMGIGSGIVYDSDAEAEWDECLLKGDFLTRNAPDFALIETILWQANGGFFLLDYHLERLAHSAAHCRYPVEIEVVKKELSNLAVRLASQGDDACRVRLLLNQQGEISLTASACPPLAKQDFVSMRAERPENLPQIKISATSTNSACMYLYHKTTNRDLYNHAREAALAEGYLEVIFTNERGEITEGSITNIFARFGATIKTPPLACGLLAGVFRKHIIEQLAGEPTAAKGPEAGLRIEESIMTRTDLAHADGIYIGNSVRGLIEVRLKGA